jgi:hypothetical protein
MTWTFIFLMFVLKIPIIGLLWIVWWAIHAQPESGDQGSDEDGGSRKPRHPRPPLRPLPRRGPHHGVQPPASPSRVRAVAGRRHRSGAAS